MKQCIAIGSTLTKEWRKELCGLLRCNLDIFSWKPADMTGVLRHIAEHRLNIRKGCPTIRKKKRGQAPKRNELKDVRGFQRLKQSLPQRWLSATRNRLEEEDEEKTAFITSQGIFCHLKMPIRLKNAGETYQRLVDKAFQRQIGQNLEVYVDDLVIKSRMKKEVIRDIEEMFKTLKEINMKLNLKKYAFGMREGTFLGYKVDADGLRVRQNKAKAVLNLSSPKCLKDMQKLNGKLASLNKFLPKLAEKSFPFFKTLKKCTKKSDFQWIAKAEMAFKKLKRLIAELPMLTAPKEKEELIMYLAATKGAISAVTGRLLKWRLKLEEHDIHYRPRTSVKGQILANFITECLEDNKLDTPIEDPKELLNPWVLFADGSSCIDSSEVGLIITNLEGIEFTYALRFRFKATNNEAEYEALISAKEPGMIKYLEKVKNLAGVFKEFSSKQVPRGKNKKVDALSKIASTSFAHLSKQVLVDELKEKSIDEKEILAVVDEERHTWMTPIYEYLTKGILPKEKRKARIIRCKAGSNEEMPFSLTYGIEAVIPVEIKMPTMRTAKVDMIKNNEALEVNLDLLEEKREQAAIQEAKSKAKMEKYYNARVHSISFYLGDLVYRSNEASRAEDGGKLGPKWEGPYEITEALGKGAYKLRDRNGNTLPRTWNVCNLKKCYVHEM
nr:reverse transcriptase domain-containing protein [Tanacetum cinerariifolium]